jgi:hypothetical protein
LESFNLLKTIKCAEPRMLYPRLDRTYAVIVDASIGFDKIEGGKGAILTQVYTNRNFRVINYALKQLIKHKKNYSPFIFKLDAFM